MTTFSQVGGILTSTRDPLLVAYKWSPNQCVKDAVNANQVVFSFLSRAFAPDLGDLIWSFSSWPLQSCQWPPDSVT